eukprot:Gb_10859 [translate_table: standard]
MSKQGKQLDDQALAILSKQCPELRDLSLSFCTFMIDVSQCEQHRMTGIFGASGKLGRIVHQQLLDPPGPPCSHPLKFPVNWRGQFSQVGVRMEEKAVSGMPIPRELSLVNCLISLGRRLACVLGQCEALTKLHLDMRVVAKNLAVHRNDLQTRRHVLCRQDQWEKSGRITYRNLVTLATVECLVAKITHLQG